MSARTAVRGSVVPVWLLLFLFGFTARGLAAPIDNNVDLDWSDLPCFPSDSPNPSAKPLCEMVNGRWRVKPAEELIRIVGAPRLVPDASNAGDLLDIFVDFVGVSLPFLAGAPDGKTPFILNVFDIARNPILVGGNPLQLTYFLPPSPLNVEASDAFFQLGDFDLFDQLPGGDLIFAVEFDPRLGLTDRSIDRPDHVANIVFSGAGTAVPEPGTLSLLISGVAITGMRARKRRSRRA